MAIDHSGHIETGSGYKSGTTINRMELQAPAEALVALHKEHGSCYVAVYSDSQYVVKGFNDKTRARRKNREYWRQLEEAADLHTYCEINFINGHNSNGNNFYNGLADKIAGETRKEGIRGKRNGK